MTTNDESRAALFLAKGRELGMSDDAIYMTADDLLDTDVIDFPADTRPLAALGVGLYDYDDDYDDFRHELRVLLGPAFTDELDSSWDDDAD